jgi:hypothetical protein
MAMNILHGDLMSPLILLLILPNGDSVVISGTCE